VADDGSTDATWRVLESAKSRVPTLRPVQNAGLHGFGRAIACGVDHMTGDAAVITMADESDDACDVVRYWQKLNESYNCVFGSRFMRGGGVIDYPKPTLILNRLANYFIKVLFRITLNDTTNAFKPYRKEVSTVANPLSHRTSTRRLNSFEGNRSWIFMDNNPDYVAESPDGNFKATNERTG